MILAQRKYTVWDIVTLSFRSALWPAGILTLLKIGEGLVPTLSILATASFVDTALAVAGGAERMARIWLPLACVVLLVAYNWVQDSTAGMARDRLLQGVRLNYRSALLEKRARLAFRNVEDHDAWDLIERVFKEPEIAITNGMAEVLAALTVVMRVAGLLSVLLFQVWWSAPLILGISIPLFWLAMKAGRVIYDAERETSRMDRRSNYLFEVLTSREAAEERTLFGYTSAMNDVFYDTWTKSSRIKLKTELKGLLRTRVGGVITSCISIFISLVLLQPVLAGRITIGIFIGLINAVFRLVSTMTWQLSFLTKWLTIRHEYMKDLAAFLALEETDGATDPPAKGDTRFRSLELRDVSFTYPGTEKPIFSGLSMRLVEGKHYAFVGVNGSGKTTLTKLLSGLYTNYEGEILLNGRSLRDFALSEVKAMIAQVHQDFARYSISVEDNIALGNVNAMEAGTPNADHAINQVGLRPTVDALPHGIKTPLGKILADGQDLSGGEWQRLAMARALASPAPLRILDEPTAALDPLSESRLYEQFEKMSEGKTTIFISHRLGSTMLADEIFVLGEGRLLESGTHRGLMARHGLYAQMYESQRSWYQEGVVGA